MKSKEMFNAHREIEWDEERLNEVAEQMRQEQAHYEETGEWLTYRSHLSEEEEKEYLAILKQEHNED